MTNNFNKTLLKNITHLFLGIIPFVLIMILSSCEEDPSPLGANLLPESDKVKFRFDSTFSFKGNVTEYNEIITSGVEFYNLGEIYDPYFGSFKGQFAGQLLPQKFYTVDSTVYNFKLDSVVLFLEIDSVYGLPEENVSFSVYELNTALEDSSGHAYYSNEDISQFYSPADIISTNYFYRGDTLIGFVLDDDFANRLIPTDILDTTYKNLDNFLTKYKGIAIISSMQTTPGGLFNIKMSSRNSKMIMYHNDSLEFSYSFNRSNYIANRFAQYTRDYSSSILNNYLNNDETESDDLLFIQGINGVISKIQFTNIKQWFEQDSSYSILNAELTIPVFKDDNFDLFYPPGKLFLSYYDQDSIFHTVEDYNSKGFFDGTYNKEKSQYRFNISKHLKHLLNGEITDSCLNISIYDKTKYPHRVILKSADEFKLKVTYTKH